MTTSRRLFNYLGAKRYIAPVQGDFLRISVERFKELADCEYDAGWGSQKVAADLTLIMKDGSWYTRGTEDGAEWWEYHRMPVIIDEVSDSRVRIIVGATPWDDTLESMNPECDDDNEKKLKEKKGNE